MSSKLIRIKTDSNKFNRQYLTLLSPMIVREKLSKEEIDILCSLNRFADQGKFDKKSMGLSLIELTTNGYPKSTEQLLNKIIKTLRKKKVINRNQIRQDLFPKLDKNYKLMFYFYE